MIPWEDIKAIWLSQVHSGRYSHDYAVSLEFEHPEKYLQQMTALARWNLKLQPRLGHYVLDGFALDAKGIDMYNYISIQQQLGQISVPIIRSY